MEGADKLLQKLTDTGQSHLWNHLLSLPPDQQPAFRLQLQNVNWDLVRSHWEWGASADATDKVKREKAERSKSPNNFVRQPRSDSDRAMWQQAYDMGLQLPSDGNVAAVVVAGGQGTRLGFDQPKGMFPIGPVSGHSLFQIFCEQILARGRNAGRAIPYGVMTSDATHAATVQYFEDHDYFGLAPADVYFFLQGSEVAVDAETGRALLSTPGQLALSPDGHGGLLSALLECGIMDQWKRRGIETIFYHQVDNPTTQVCDPAFLGFHTLHQADVSTKVVAKRNASEKMGVAVSVDGVSMIVEYSDLSPELAAETDENGGLIRWAGNTAIHVFQLEFLRKYALEGFEFHIAKKIVPYVDESGKIVTPQKPNAFKFEKFIFDLLPKANTSLIVEADRAAEFNPVKNKDGQDSPETCRAGMQALHRKWIRAAGAIIGDDVPVEIGPLFALNEEDVKRRLSASDKFTSPTSLND
jgi:UDP-N-acetylglucosamine/UDP-N-acetylgalactosamine diphosphorylase